VRGVLASTACCALLVGCGGGERQDAGERSATYDVDIVASDFPEEQSISTPATLRLAVRNAGDRAIPNLAVSLDGISTANDQPGLADPQQPVWVVSSSPTSGDTAYVYTWAVGRLEAGETRHLDWKLTPSTPGTHKLAWTVAAGLTGKSKAHLEGGGQPTGEFTVDISDAPQQATVDPETGEVVRK
jgi:hypothetical protein